MAVLRPTAGGPTITTRSTPSDVSAWQFRNDTIEKGVRARAITLSRRDGKLGGIAPIDMPREGQWIVVKYSKDEHEKQSTSSQVVRPAVEDYALCQVTAGFKRVSGDATAAAAHQQVLHALVQELK
eukprot:SAG22_NODE_6813_length_808_cov_1.133992_1_plen_126_part_00